ncbi:MAG: insulinase family protein [Chromatiales bacterium]|nr:insulinase family protein [Chromatiales bacterium]
MLQRIAALGFAALPLALPAMELDIPHQKHVLDNGLTLIVHESRNAPIVAVNIWYHVGSKDEPPGRTGFAHLFEHLMFQGSENFPGEYLSFVQQLGASDLNATTWFDRTNYFQTVPVNALDTILFLESDRMGWFADAITQEILEQEVGVVQNEKRQSVNQPYGRVFRHVLENVFPEGHPYSWETIGSMEDLEAATLDDVRDWFRTWYGPDNAVLVIAGDVETDDVIARVERFFGAIPPGPPLTRRSEWIPRHDVERRMLMQDRVSQARLYMAWTGPRWGTAEAQQLALAAAILGGDRNSRLHRRLVLEEQIATDVLVAPLALEISGITYAIASAQPGVSLAELESVIREELARFAAEGPTDAELERVRVQQRASLVRGLERIGGSSGRANLLAESMVFGGSPDAWKQSVADMEAATTEDLRAVVADWLGQAPFLLEVEPVGSRRASGEPLDRSAGPPEPGPEPAVSFPEFERTTLSNGLTLVVAPRPEVPLYSIRLSVDAGFAADQFASPGTASLAMAMLDEGTATRTGPELADELARLGAVLATGSTLDSSFIALSALADRLEPSLDIFADVIQNPAFPEHDLERLRRTAVARLSQERTRPNSMALRVLPQLLFGSDHPYGQPLTGTGTEDSLAAISRDDLVRFHATWLRPNAATLIVVGPTTLEEMRERFERLFRDWRPGELPVKRLAMPETTSDPVIWLLDRPGADQSVVFAGQLLPPKTSPDNLAVQTMNDVLGGTFAARINMNLRERRGWSYGAFSTILNTRAERPLLAFAPVQTDRTAETVMEIRAEFASLRAERPATEEEVERVRRSTTLSLPGRWETAGAVLNSISQLLDFGLPDDYWDGYAEAVRALTVDDINTAARRHLRPDELVIVVVGDREAISADLEELGIGEIRLIDTDGRPVTER